MIKQLIFIKSLSFYQQSQYALQMHCKKFITCSKCRYFPNKADQINHRSIKLGADQIQWDCSACEEVNVFPGSQAVILPQASLLLISKENLLKTSSQQGQAIWVVIDIQNLQSSLPAYYLPHFKEQISKNCGIQLEHLKDIETLESESKWLAQHRSFMRIFAKFTNKRFEVEQKLTNLNYLIYLLEIYIKSSKNCQVDTLQITILNGSDTFSFQISEFNVESDQLMAFLKIYSLLYFEKGTPWLLKYYQEEFSSYKRAILSRKNMRMLLLIGSNFLLNEETQNNISTRIPLPFSINEFIKLQRVIVLRSDLSHPQPCTYSISPLGTNPFLDYVLSKESDEQRLGEFSSVYFRIDGSREILTQRLQISQHPTIKEEMLSVVRTIEEKEYFLKKYLKKLIQARISCIKLKLVKLYCQVNVSNEKKVILFTFNWRKIEKELLVEELDEQIEEDHQLKEDILMEQYIKLATPSPFLKKSQQYQREECPPEANEEEYEYL